MGRAPTSFDTVMGSHHPRGINHSMREAFSSTDIMPAFSGCIIGLGQGHVVFATSAFLATKVFQFAVNVIHMNKVLLNLNHFSSFYFGI